jgi:uncharacterized protein
MKIAVIGGGVGGLAVAFELKKQAKGRGLNPPEVVVFEAQSRFGGNADTMHFTFGNGPQGEIRRWADLGVNDFNKSAYKNIDEVMTEIGFAEGKDYRNLEDTTSYYSGDGSLFFTDNASPWWGTGMDPELKATVNSFMSIAGKDGEDPAYHDYTLEQYIGEKSKENNWDSRLGPWVIYPRVNGMYFTSSELGPRRMSFYAVMHYYKIQEGAGGKPANRMYFVGGSSHWIDTLTAYMGSSQGVKLVPNFPALVARDSSGWMVKSAEGPEVFRPDIVVIATHANDALKLLETVPPHVSNILAQVTYESAISVAHVDSRLLPVDQNAWCTYNIVIHEPSSVAMKPYVINYVANRHQNDAANPEYNKFGLPQFFVSVNPHLPIRDSMVLKDDHGREAIAYLHHNVFDFACMRAQADIIPEQGRMGLYYAGGWTYGSGLHEECWQQGIDIAGQILGHLMTGEEPKHAPIEAHELVLRRLRRTSDA